MRTLLTLLLAVIASGFMAAYAATDFEVPADESPAASLPPSQIGDDNFRIQDPVHSDGLMHHYVIESRFGVFSAYGHDALSVRLREVQALATIERTSDSIVVMRSVARGIDSDAKAFLQVATHPIGTVLGLPKGIRHLLGGYKANAEEISTQARKALSQGESSSSGNASGLTASQATRLAKRYADRYLGLSAADRRWYATLGVDPYTTNAVLRRAVGRLARIDAGATFAMRFAPIGIPFAGEVNRALAAIYNEDPAVLRMRRHQALAGFGLSPEEIERFEDAILLTPTRQTVLVDAAQRLGGVEGRAALLRHASEVTSEEEIEVFLRSTALMLRFHAQQPVARIIPGLRIPSAQLADGSTVLFGAFDAVQWTEDVAGYVREARMALPDNIQGRDIWFTGSVSARARSELEALGWTVHDHAEAALPARLPS